MNQISAEENDKTIALIVDDYLNNYSTMDKENQFKNFPSLVSFLNQFLFCYSKDLIDVLNKYGIRGGASRWFTDINEIRKIIEEINARGIVKIDFHITTSFLSIYYSIGFINDLQYDRNLVTDKTKIRKDEKGEPNNTTNSILHHLMYNHFRSRKRYEIEQKPPRWPLEEFKLDEIIKNIELEHISTIEGISKDDIKAMILDSTNSSLRALCFLAIFSNTKYLKEIKTGYKIKYVLEFWDLFAYTVKDYGSFPTREEYYERLKDEKARNLSKKYSGYNSFRYSHSIKIMNLTTKEWQNLETLWLR